MIRAQIQFEERQYQRIRSLANRRRVSIAEMVRRLVEAGLRSGDSASGPRSDSLLALVGIGSSGIKDLGRSHDKYLEWEATRRRTPRRRKRKR